MPSLASSTNSLLLLVSPASPIGTPQQLASHDRSRQTTAKITNANARRGMQMQTGRCAREPVGGFAWPEFHLSTKTLFPQATPWQQISSYRLQRRSWACRISSPGLPFLGAQRCHPAVIRCRPGALLSSKQHQKGEAPILRMAARPTLRSALSPRFRITRGARNHHFEFEPSSAD